MTSISDDARAALTARLGAAVKFNEPLAKHTSARIGGPADAFLAADSQDDLRDAARIAWDHDVPLRVIGGGSNILISDRGVKGLVIHNRTSDVSFTGNTCIADSGLGSIKLARYCASRGLTGFEWAIGLPGTLGGAVYGNAGAHSGDMSDSVQFVYAMTPHNPDVTWSGTSMAFEYRSSIIKREGRECVILSAMLEFQPDDPALIKERMADFTTYRKRTQPPGATIGSMFKNPPGDYAGRLIEACNLKGHRIGGAQISEVHANFFLNVDDATGDDVYALAQHARECVMREFGGELELEIERVGEWD